MSDDYFKKYRKHLSDEVIKLSGFISIYRTLNEKKNDRLDAMNFAPAFFGNVITSLYTSIVLWTSKLFDPKSERGFVDLMNFAESNIGLFSKSKFMTRNSVKKDYWLFKTGGWKALSVQEIQAHRTEIANCEALNNIHHQRDKFHAHFDKEYFFNRGKMNEDAPVTWNNLEEIRALMDKILNRYSSAFDGSGLSITAVNIEDVSGLLDVVQKYIDDLDSKIHGNNKHPS